MKLEKFSTMFTDFRFWITNVIYDVLRVDKPTIIKQLDFSWTTNVTDQEYVIRGNILQIDSIGGNFELYIKFNELDSPQYRVLGKSTFRIPFYRFFITVLHNGGALASQCSIKISMNCAYDGLNTIDLAGKNANQMLAFNKMQSYILTIPAGGQLVFNWTTLFGNYPTIIRFLRLYNTDGAITLQYQIPDSNPRQIDFFPTQQVEFNFAGCGWRVIPNANDNTIRFFNSGANNVDVQMIVGANYDNTL